MNHLTEWAQSCVDPQLTALNVIPLNGQTAYNYLLYSDDLPRCRDGRLRATVRRRYQHLEEGGWWCSGINPMTGEDDPWGCFKPSQPRSHDGKPIKYEHPPKTSTGLFALRVTQNLWQQIANRSHLELTPECLQPDRADLGFWQWVQDNPKVPLCITEGAKKAGTLLSAGYGAIALPGINNGYRIPKDERGRRIGRPHLIEQLQSAIGENRTVYIVFDQDSKPNSIRAVNHAIWRMGTLLQQAGCTVRVVTWSPELGKGVDDLIAREGREAFDRAYEGALLLDRWKAATGAQLTHSRSQTLETRYLPSDLTIPETAQLVAIKSAKGTGKTHLLQTVIQEAKQTQRPILVISHRVQLVESLSARLQLPVLHQNPSPIPGYVLCIDSLHPDSRARFDPQDWENALIIIDEVEQVLWHGLNSSTCRSKRVPILKTLKALIRTALGTGGKLWAMDADLSDISLDYLIALSGIDPEVHLIENCWKPSLEEAWQVYNYADKTPERLVRDLEQYIARGGRPMVCLSAQKRGSKWGTITLETYFQQRFGDRNILRIDSETLNDPNHPVSQYTRNGQSLDALLSQYDLVLASPAIETGVSIDLRGHFTSVWAIAQGVQGESSVRQALGRLREPVPRYIWVASCGFNRVGNGSTSLSNLLGSEHKLTQVNIRLLQQSDFTELDDLDTGFQAESLMAWAKLAVRFNGGMVRYREAVLGGLVVEGHCCQEVPVLPELPAEVETQEPSLKAAIDEVLAQNYQAECEAIAQTAPLSNLPPKQGTKTLHQRRMTRHREIWQKYGIPVTPEVVSLDDRGWYAQLQYHYFLTIGRPYLADRDAGMARQLLSARSGELFLPDFNNSQLGSRIGTMELLGIPGIIADPERQLINTDLDLQELQDIALRNRPEIKSLFGMGLAKNASPIAIASRFLSLLGYRLNYLRCRSQKNESGALKRLRIYGLVCPNDPRDRVFEQWLERDRAGAKRYYSLPSLPEKVVDNLECDRYQQLSLFDTEVL
ncbi:plasmid replication protein, CyRepA1 family [Roseofilum casamattae]|uniref:DUF3854 domain-containing protein n=1 Tax=Roseofilum casamattae BLCC-M143 TaxID=3022442 RepID=A0ABT7BSN5_9CYAN|nr:plasmid replication protein, CyRepA1 family [Roseofilum casamattae]MDJ1182202.1 DUF3854 domain-containing protein [Roseofilum casamattae BLCC-M143]